MNLRSRLAHVQVYLCALAMLRFVVTIIELCSARLGHNWKIAAAPSAGSRR